MDRRIETLVHLMSLTVNEVVKEKTTRPFDVGHFKKSLTGYIASAISCATRPPRQPNTDIGVFAADIRVMLRAGEHVESDEHTERRYDAANRKLLTWPKERYMLNLTNSPEVACPPEAVAMRERCLATAAVELDAFELRPQLTPDRKTKKESARYFSFTDDPEHPIVRNAAVQQVGQRFIDLDAWAPVLRTFDENRVWSMHACLAGADPVVLFTDGEWEICGPVRIGDGVEEPFKG